MNTGEVVAGEASQGQRLVTGDAVNVAARLEQAAPALEVLIGQPTYALVRDHVEVEEVEPLTLKGKAQPVRAYRLLAVGSGRRARARERPWSAATRRWRSSRAPSTAWRRTAVPDGDVIGDAGVGKTRLTQEFLDSIGRRARRSLRGRCLPYGDGITFWPIVEVVRRGRGDHRDRHGEEAREKLQDLVGDDEVAERVGAAIGLIERRSRSPSCSGASGGSSRCSPRERPIVVVFDDIHWAEPTFLDLIERLTATIEGAPVMILCTSRHELLEKQPDVGRRPERADGSCSGRSRRGVANDRGEPAGAGGAPRQASRRRCSPPPKAIRCSCEQLLSMLIDSGMLGSDDGGGSLARTWPGSRSRRRSTHSWRPAWTSFRTRSGRSWTPRRSSVWCSRRPPWRRWSRRMPAGDPAHLERLADEAAHAAGGGRRARRTGSGI